MSTDTKKSSSDESKPTSESKQDEGMVKYGVPPETLDPESTRGLEADRRKKRKKPA